MNTRILYGPVKAQAPVERRVPTKPEPFKLTDIKKPETVNLIEEPVFKFHAKPVPKSVLEPPKQPVKHVMKVGPPPPKLSNQWSKRSRDNVSIIIWEVFDFNLKYATAHFMVLLLHRILLTVYQQKSQENVLKRIGSTVA